MNAEEILMEHRDLAERRRLSTDKIRQLRAKIAQRLPDLNAAIAIFAAGSIGRLEAGENSDLDIFVVAKPHGVGKLTEVRLLSRLADINDELKLPAFSDEMRYMRVYDGDDLVKHTGKPRDDSENFFTTRMLLLLESSWLQNENMYQSLIELVCGNYFRDNKGKKDFKPLFLINDILRYWRTLCLNYEQCREDPNKPWRKKNMNLRFSRLTTVFSTVALLMVERPSMAEQFVMNVKLTPLERLARAVNKLGNEKLLSEFGDFVDHYSTFLRIKDSSNPEKLLEKGDIKDNVRRSAERVAQYFSDLFADQSLKSYARYLTL